MHRSLIPVLALSACLAVLAPARAATFDLSTASIADINAAFNAGALNSEKLVGLYLKRIAAYDKQGPRVNSVITPNPKALDEAAPWTRSARPRGRARRSTGSRSW